MNVLNVYKQIEFNSVSKFWKYDSTNKIIKIPKSFKKNIHKIIPVCIRNQFYSHMIVFIVSDKTLIKYDPAYNSEHLNLENTIMSKFKCTLLKRMTSYKKIDCTNLCIKFILDYIQTNNDE